MNSKDINNYYDNNEEYGDNYSNPNNLNYQGNYIYENDYNNGNEYTNENDYYNGNEFANENNYYNNTNDYNNTNNYYNNNYQNNYQYYNNNYNGKIFHYYNNYPIYSSIPASIPNSNQEGYNDYNQNKSNNIKDKTSLRGKKSKGGIVLKINKQDICHARPPEYAPGYVPTKPGRPAYADQPLK